MSRALRASCDVQYGFENSSVAGNSVASVLLWFSLCVGVGVGWILPPLINHLLTPEAGIGSNAFFFCRCDLTTVLSVATIFVLQC